MSEPSFTVLPGRQLRIADFGAPCVVIAGTLMQMIIGGAASPGVSWEAPGCPVNQACPPRRRGVPPHVIGGILRVDAVNGRLIYRITEYLPDSGCYIGEWPD